MSSRQEKEACGALLANILAGAWRDPAPPVTFSERELEAAVLPLLKTSAGALAWWRIKDSPMRDAPVAAELLETYRLYILHAALNTERIEHVFTHFNRHGIQALLFKGHVNAVCYPEPNLRPYGDIDLLVGRAQYADARTLLDEISKGQGSTVDLHEDDGRHDGRDFATLYARRREMRAGNIEACVMGAEDHLRLLCFHFLKHGAWRPLWLCDIAAALEARPADFDWSLCIGTHAKRAEYVRLVIGLAHDLLGARTDETPARDAVLPRWLMRDVRRAWARQTSGNSFPPPPLRFDWRTPASMMRGVRRRFPGSIEATYSVGMKFNNFPRLPLRYASFLQLIGDNLTPSDRADSRTRRLRYF
ncbi:MAG: nucleotidyltransferase family protein [Pyrinomonadaceae bacterium MAG19_C2-C3]|nr:nucleotidyltransferase family protein [Pyrinomonadaceae bacterium MAG19_C2-C3]